MLHRLAGETERVKILEDRLPAGGLQGLLDYLRADGAFDRECLISWPGIAEGKDAWGQSVILDVRKDGEIHFRSIGPNGIDEKGKGDDIDVQVPPRRSKATKKGNAFTERRLPFELSWLDRRWTYVPLGHREYRGVNTKNS
ncbi:MAG TPA: hypothetical protein VGN12_12135 [Pirellulales bacterium]|jgi:hypothetical protein